MTRLRGFGLVCIVAAVLLEIVARHIWSELRNSPFGYELGSVAFPVPGYLQAVSFCAVLFAVAGLILTARDLVRWIRKKLHDSAN
jgi:hypothetical protein